MLVVKGVNLTRIVAIVVLLVILVIIPLRLAAYYLLVLKDVLLWVALAVAWDFFSGYTKYVSLGSAAFFGLGLYVTAWVMDASPALPLPVIVLFAGLVNFALALAIGLVTLRLRGIYFAIVTFSVSMVISNFISYWESAVTHTRGTYVPVFSIQGIYYTMLVGTIVVLSLTALLRRSKFGLALKMIGENEEAAVHVGVNASIYKTLGFAISAMLMGFIGACFITAEFGYVNTDIAFDASYSFYPAVMSLLGGMGTVYGPMIGATFLALLSDLLTVTLTSYFMIALGLILIVVVMFMPNGILGVIEKIRTKGLRGSIMGIVEKARTAKPFRSRKEPEKVRKKPAKAPEKPP
jgi:branched-chain amino acid transport system permease protein